MVVVRPGVLLFILSLFCLPAFPADFETSIEKKLFDAINAERVQRGIAAMAWSEKLQESARKHTERLAANGKLSHQFDGEPPLQARIAATGFHYSASAENVALATHFDDLHPALMNSPGHRANILNPKYTAVGIGVVHKGDAYYTTENFSRATEDASTDEAEHRMANAINRYRKERGMRAVKVIFSKRLRNTICDQAEHEKLQAKSLITDDGYFGATAATSPDLDVIPPSTEEVMAKPDLDRVAIGACFRVTNRYPGGVYWFAFEY